MDKFRNKLPKDELKRLGKDIAKKLVASDYKNNRVGDPAAQLTEKQERNIKKYVKEFLDRAVIKYDGHHKKKTTGTVKRTATDVQAGTNELTPGVDAPGEIPAGSFQDVDAAEDEGEDMILSDVEVGSPESSDRKRKRDSGAGETLESVRLDGPDMKRLREEGTSETSSPPPPPPPPPPGSTPENGSTDRDQTLREQEEALMRENEEAQRLEDEQQAINGQHTPMDQPSKAQTSELLSH